jgi:chromosome segregation ATPase
MRSDRDDMVRYREECKRLQIVIADLKKNQRIIQGVPEKQHNEAIAKIESLERRVNSQAEAIATLKAAKADNRRPVAEASEKVARAAGEAQVLKSEADRLRLQLQSARTSLVKLAKQKNAQIRDLQGRVNELEGTLRAYNDNPN